MNGGAWLHCNGTKVDVLLRDLDAIEHWARRSEQGEFEIDALLGYVAGVPTYLLTAELASCRLLRGELSSASFPEKLRAAAPAKWRFCRAFSLDYARAHAKRGQIAGVVGQAATAVMCEAHAIVCARGEWICNEKHLVAAAGLSGANELFAEVSKDPGRLAAWVDRVAEQLGLGNDEAAPWARRS